MDIQTNIRKLAIVFIAFFLALSAGLVYWQVLGLTNQTYRSETSGYNAAESGSHEGKQPVRRRWLRP